MNNNIENNVTDLFSWGASLEPQEEWRPVVGFEGLYQVSNLGRVRNARNGFPMAISRASKGAGRVEKEHAAVYLYREGHMFKRRVHVLVLEAFRGERPEGMLALHRDDDKDNNTLENLYWGTVWDNRDDARRNGVYERRAALQRERRAMREWHLIAA